MLKSAVGLASVASGLCIVAAVITVGYLFNDINNFYDDAMNELSDFKIAADGAWDDMIATTAVHEREARDVHRFRKQSGHSGHHEDSHNIFRNKKQALGSQCNCGPQPNTCPPGPPGPPGQPGAHGEDGHPGNVGAPGHNGIGLGGSPGKTGCINCPAGAPGPKGAPGSAGPAGSDGHPGQDGGAGQPGQDGHEGQAGNAGRPGNDGQPGHDGRPGRSGKRVTGRPGRPGPAGSRGPAGHPGSKGQPGGNGQPGAQGPAGPNGQPGAPGNDGTPGVPGSDGQPGGDAAYCPCPSRNGVAPVTGGHKSAYAPAKVEGTSSAHRHRVAAKKVLRKKVFRHRQAVQA